MRRSLLTISTAALAALLASGPTPAGAKELSDVKVDLVNRAPSNDPDEAAAGALRLRLQESRAQLQLRFKRLTPDAWYAVVSEDVERTCFQASGRGSANLKLLQTAAAPNPDFFDPRGEDVFIERVEPDCTDPVATTEVLCASLDPSKGNGNGCKGPRMKVNERTQLLASAAADGGSAELTYRVQPNGKERLSVRVKHVPSGYLYTVYMGDAYRGTLSPNSGGVGRLDFRDKPRGSKTKALDFEPYDEDVEICSDATAGPADEICEYDGTSALAFSGPLRAQIPGVNACDATLELEVDLSGPTGSGEASLELEEDCEEEFEVSVEGLPEGDYDVFVGDDPVAKGTFTVGPDGSGEIEFESEPTDVDEDDLVEDAPSEDGDDLPLDFDPRGQEIRVVALADGSTVLAGTLSPPLP